MFERSQSTRYPASALPSLRASILAGPDVQLIDVSRCGLLIDSDARLMPGVAVRLNLTLGEQVYLVSGRIGLVDAALVDAKMKYRAEVALDEECPIFDSLASAGVVTSSPDVADDSVEPAALQAHVERDEFELDMLRQEVARYRRQLDEQQDALDGAHQALVSGEALRLELRDAHAAEQAAWDGERQLLEDRLRRAEQRASDAERHLDAARENERRLLDDHEQERSRLAAALAHHEQERSSIAAALQERDERLAQLAAAHDALQSELTLSADAHQRECAEWKLQYERVTSQLHSVEGWCAGTQHLLDRVRLDMGSVFALLEAHAAAPTAVDITRAAGETAAPAFAPEERLTRAS
jgi:hypothetical protein